MLARAKDIVSSFMLAELFKGMRLTGRHLFARKITVMYPEEKTPMSPRFRGLHALRRYPNGEELVKCIFCGFCEESCPVDSIVETHILEYHGENRGDLLYTKPMLLAIGDKYEAQIAAARGEDATYR